MQTILTEIILFKPFSISAHVCTIGKTGTYITAEYVVDNFREGNDVMLKVINSERLLNSVDDFRTPVTSLIKKTWQPGEMFNVRVIGMKTISDEIGYIDYFRKKKEILEFAESVGGYLRQPELYQDGIKPVTTAINDHSLILLTQKVESCVNEYYLFCIVDESKVDREYEDHVYLHREKGPLGKAYYFSDNLAHECQDKGELFRSFINDLILAIF